MRYLFLGIIFWIIIGFTGCQWPSEANSSFHSDSKGQTPQEIPLAVIATEPETPTVLGLGEKLVVIIHCDPPTPHPVQVWARPYEKGVLAMGYTAHSLAMVSKQNRNTGIVTGWFYFNKPKTIDEVRVFMRDVSTNKILITRSYKVDAKWESELSISKSDSNKLASSKSVRKRPPLDTTVYTIAIGDSPILGAKEAVVTIVEFGDFQCPYCVREYPKIQQILTQYPDQVRFVFKHYPLNFHKKAPQAHAAVELARREKGSEAFWKMHDLIMANPRNLEISDLRRYAQTLNLDLNQFDSIMADPEKINDLIKSDLAEAKKCNVRATPTVLINGLKMTNRTLEGYRTRINNILKN